MRNLIQLCTLSAVVMAVSCAPQPEKATSDQPPGYNPNAVHINSIAPDRGLADPHNLYVDGRMYVMCGHDRDWDIVDHCHMDRWEMWSTDNLKDWRYELSIDSSETYMGDEEYCWAGDLAEKDGTYYWYFSYKNYSTGVMSAPSITGPWKDALGEPLLPTDIIPTKKPYDPEIYEENGRYSIIFGVNQYYIATLGDDMISLKDEPRKIMVYEEDGVTRKGTADKPSLFKRDGWFYLWWGDQYAMSRKLEGPYIYKGSFIGGAHGAVFQWTDGQWYAIQEQHETNAFYRGVQLNPLYFNDDATVYIPEHNWEYPLPGRNYDYTHSRMGWRCEGGGTEVEWVSGGDDIQKGYIKGEVDQKGAIITSVPFIHTPIHLCKDFTVTLNNRSGAKMMRMALYTYSDDLKPYTRLAPQKVDWTAEEWITIPLEQGVQSIDIPLDRFTKCDDYLHQIAIQPMADMDSGAWEIDRVKLNY